MSQPQENQKRCRECRSIADERRLLKVCGCENDRTWVHLDCLVMSFAANGYEKCPRCLQPYTGIRVTENPLHFWTYICVKERVKRISSSLLLTSFAFYTVYLGLFQFMQSRKILRGVWNFFLFFFIVFFSSLFTLFSIYSAISLYTDYKQWLAYNKSLTVVVDNPDNPITLTKIITIRRTI